VYAVQLRIRAAKALIQRGYQRERIRQKTRGVKEGYKRDKLGEKGRVKTERKQG
jgi:hypothetical protein